MSTDISADVSLLHRHVGVGGPASAFPRHASLVVALVLVSRASFARKLGARLAARAALAGTSALQELGWVRREARVVFINHVSADDLCARMIVALDRTARALGSSVALRFAQLGDLREGQALPLRAYCHPARDNLRQAHAIAIVFDLCDRARLSSGEVKAQMMRAGLLADGHKRSLPMLLLGANSDVEGAASLSELRTLLGPAQAPPPRWEVCRLLFIGRRSASSPLHLLPDELISAVLLRLSAGSAWGSEFALDVHCDEESSGIESRASVKPAGMCCWQCLSSTMVVTLPSAQARAGAVRAHAARWLAAQLESTAAWVWNGPQPMEITWVPADAVKGQETARHDGSRRPVGFWI